MTTFGRKPKPTAFRRLAGNPGKRAWNHAEPKPPNEMPECPAHLTDAARAEWHRLAETLNAIGVLTMVDRAALAAYCQAWGRWVEAEEKMQELPTMLKTPSGYVQQNPWLSVANKQLELMHRFMTEIGLTPASRSRIVAWAEAEEEREKGSILFQVVYEQRDGSLRDATWSRTMAAGRLRKSTPASCDLRSDNRNTRSKIVHQRGR
jgi:P27 family predicted phage terminase small subunit